MHVIYAIARLVPYWALPLAFVIAEVGRYFRRRGSSKQWTCFAIAALLGILTLLWIGFRGDLHSDAWVRSIVGA